MKTKVLLVTLLLTLVAIPTMARQPLYDVQIGFHNPDVTDTGLIFGVLAGTEIDERVDVGFSLDFFRKSYEKTTNVLEDDGSGGFVPSSQVTDVKSSITMFPLLFHARYKIPMSGDNSLPLLPYVQAGLGYSMAWYGYENYETDEDESKYFGGFTMRFAVGAMYQLGSSSRVSLELFYMAANLSREDEDPEIGRPVESELDMSGLGVRLGLHF